VRRFSVDFQSLLSKSTNVGFKLDGSHQLIMPFTELHSNPSFKLSQQIKVMGKTLCNEKSKEVFGIVGLTNVKII
jgi:hypothetical protein